MWKLDRRWLSSTLGNRSLRRTCAFAVIVPFLFMVIVELLPYDVSYQGFPPRVVAYNIYARLSYCFTLGLLDGYVIECGIALDEPTLPMYMSWNLVKLLPANIVGTIALIYVFRLSFGASLSARGVKLAIWILMMVVLFWIWNLIGVESLSLRGARGWRKTVLEAFANASFMAAPLSFLALINHGCRYLLRRFLPRAAMNMGGS